MQPCLSVQHILLPNSVGYAAVQLRRVKRYPVFVMRFALAPMISGPFVVSMCGTAAPVEWGHIIAGFATIYLIIGLLIRSFMYRELRLPAFVALLLALMEAIPGVPRLHAAVSPLLFTTLAWATVAMPSEPYVAGVRNKRIWILPALVLLAILYGVGYRHATSGFAPHIGAAMLAAGTLLIVCVVFQQNYSDDTVLRGVTSLAIAVVVFQIVAGATAFVVRMLDINGGLLLGLARTAHITGAALLLAITTMLAIQYRRRSA